MWIERNQRIFVRQVGSGGELILEFPLGFGTFCGQGVLQFFFSRLYYGLEGSTVMSWTLGFKLFLGVFVCAYFVLGTKSLRCLGLGAWISLHHLGGCLIRCEKVSWQLLELGSGSGFWPAATGMRSSRSVVGGEGAVRSQ